MRQARIVLCGLIAVSLWAATVYGHPLSRMAGMGPRAMMGDGPGMLLPLVLKGVDLTPDQETRLHAIMAAHRPVLRTLFSEIKAAHGEMADKLLAPGQVSAADLSPHLQRIAQLREQLLQEGLKAALEVREVLTPEQLVKAAQLKERIKSLRAEMRSLFEEKQ